MFFFDITTLTISSHNRRICCQSKQCNLLLIMVYTINHGYHFGRNFDTEDHVEPLLKFESIILQDCVFSSGIRFFYTRISCKGDVLWFIYTCLVKCSYWGCNIIRQFPICTGGKLPDDWTGNRTHNESFSRDKNILSWTIPQRWQTFSISRSAWRLINHQGLIS